MCPPRSKLFPGIPSLPSSSFKLNRLNGHLVTQLTEKLKVLRANPGWWREGGGDLHPLAGDLETKLNHSCPFTFPVVCLYWSCGAGA